MKSSGAISVSMAEKAGRPWWLWLHVLSLDAVLVALAGQEAFAHVQNQKNVDRESRADRDRRVTDR